MSVARSRQKHKGRGGTPPFFQLKHQLLDLPAYIALPHTAKSLLVDMGRQYKGYNNGDLCIALTVLKPRGWNSSDTLWRALQALIDADLVMQTRQGGKNLCGLYAFTWLPINECGGKLEVAETSTPPIPLHAHPSLK